MVNGSKLHKNLPFEITTSPVDLDIKEIKPGIKGFYEQANDHLWENNETINRAFTLKIGLGMFLLPALWCGWIFAENGSENTFFGIIISLILIIPGIFTIFYSKYAPAKKLVLNRLEGTIELPGFLFKKQVKIKFENLNPVVDWGVTSGVLGAKHPVSNWLDNFKTPTLLFIGGDPYQSWSRIVWYMDKNRPLPPGTAFDPYRKKDDERRKMEGNLPPLYPSNIQE